MPTRTAATALRGRWISVTRVGRENWQRANSPTAASRILRRDTRPPICKRCRYIQATAWIWPYCQKKNYGYDTTVVDLTITEAGHANNSSSTISTMRAWNLAHDLLPDPLQGGKGNPASRQLRERGRVAFRGHGGPASQRNARRGFQSQFSSSAASCCGRKRDCKRDNPTGAAGH